MVRTDHILTIKQGDTKHGVMAVLKDKNGNPVDLTGLTVLFRMSNGVEINAQVEDATNGVVFAPLEETATAEHGRFDAEFVVVYRDGRRETFPNDGYIRINILKKAVK